MKIEDYIPHGKANALSRKMLCQISGLDDRKMRKAIENARERDVLICCEQDGSGYYIAQTKEEILRQYRQDTARAMSILKRRTPFRRKLIELGVDSKCL